MTHGKLTDHHFLKTYFFKEWREAKGLSQSQLGRLMGMAAASISRIESGQRDWTRSFLEDFAEIMGCEVWQPLCRAPEAVEKVQVPLPNNEFEALQRALAERLAITARQAKRDVRKVLERRGKGRSPGVKKKPSADSA